MVEDLDLFCLAQENNKKGVDKPPPLCYNKEKTERKEKMIVMTPNRLDVTLDSKEEKIIQDCVYVLKSIQEKMYEFNCSVLENINGETITDGGIDDILADLNVLIGAIEMYDK